VLRVLAILGSGGVVLSAIYLLWAYQRVFHGQPKVPHAERKSLWRTCRSVSSAPWCRC